jgi:hypothetical protein
MVSTYNQLSVTAEVIRLTKWLTCMKQNAKRTMSIQKLAAFLHIRRKGEANGTPLLFLLLSVHSKIELALLKLKEVDRFGVLYAYGLSNAAIG